MGNMGGGDRGAAVSYYEVPENSRNVVVVVVVGELLPLAAESCQEVAEIGLGEGMAGASTSC